VNREVLCRPFAPEAIKQRQGAHRETFSYVDVASVIDRLNEGCDAWSFDVVSHEVYDDEVVVLGRLTADGVVKMAFGTQSSPATATGGFGFLNDLSAPQRIRTSDLRLRRPSEQAETTGKTRTQPPRCETCVQASPHPDLAAAGKIRRATRPQAREQAGARARAREVRDIRWAAA
jgi:hypothetical protein